MRVAAVAALVLLCAGCGGKAAPSFRGTPVTPPAATPGFTLPDQAGKAVSLAGEQGHPVIVTFLYTHCPDVCPLIAGTLNAVLKAPVARSDGLRVLAVSVDPKGDTRASVARFVAEHKLVPAFRYLTGTRAQLAQVWKGFHVAAAAGPGGSVTHSSVEILIDASGRERVVYDTQVTAAAVVHDLGLLAR